MTAVVSKDQVSALLDYGTADAPLQVKGYSVTLDEARTPYVDATLTVALPEPEVLALLDPTQNHRVYLTLFKQGVRPVIDDSFRSFDLRLRAVTVNAEDAEATLSLSSDEAALIISGKGGTAVDTSFNSFTDLRNLVTAVLDYYDYTLESGTVTADITRTANVQNLVTNPSIETGTTNWVSSTASATLSRATTQALQGSYSLTSTTNSGQTAVGFFGAPSVGGPYIGVTPGTVYRWSFWARASVASRSITPNVRFFDSGGTNLGDVAGTLTALSNTGWTLVTMTATAPAGAAKAAPWATGTSWAATNVLYADVLTFHEAVDAYSNTPTFSGAGAYPTDAHYAYTWDGTANASTSTRTRLDDRSPDALSRAPGSKTWDWLNGIVRAAGLRLFCDELRKWRLVNDDYSVDGSVTLTQAYNLTRGNDTIDIGAADTGANGYVEQVVVHYSWLDSKTAQPKEAWDSSGLDGGITVTVERPNTPYPGAGYAASLLARMTGRKRTLDVSALTDLKATPGMDVAATLPTTVQTGKVSSVTFGDNDEMDIGTRGLINTPANAWLFAVGPWSAATGTWAGATGSN